MPFLNVAPFGKKLSTFVIENENDTAFHEAYLLSNSLSFKSPNLKMPNWVLIDCALMQSAVVGFMRPVSDIPEALLTYYRNDPTVDLAKLDHIPVSGQVAASAIGGESLIGISLFSLGRETDNTKKLGLYTKALAMEVYKAASYEVFCGIAQYDNPAIKIHGRFSSRMEIHQPMVPLHPGKDMTLIYKMKVDYDPHRLDEPLDPVEPTFWLNARDLTAKKEMQAGIKDGNSYAIVPPHSVLRNGEVLLPVLVNSPRGVALG
jgi:hypothetical protein